MFLITNYYKQRENIFSRISRKSGKKCLRSSTIKSCVTLLRMGQVILYSTQHIAHAPCIRTDYRDDIYFLREFDKNWLISIELWWIASVLSKHWWGKNWFQEDVRLKFVLSILLNPASPFFLIFLYMKCLLRADYFTYEKLEAVRVMGGGLMSYSMESSTNHTLVLVAKGPIDLGHTHMCPIRMILFGPIRYFSIAICFSTWLDDLMFRLVILSQFTDAHVRILIVPFQGLLIAVMFKLIDGTPDTRLKLAGVKGHCLLQL